jgi:hypothetical protein
MQGHVNGSKCERHRRGQGRDKGKWDDDGSLSQGISQENQAHINVACIRETEDETRRDI